MILVEWTDSNVTHGWHLEDDTLDNVVSHCRTAGILVAENTESITLAMGVSDCGSVLETITIPRGCIKSIKKLRVR